MKRKISFVITCLLRSGAERVVALLAEHCFEQGYDVEIIMLLYPGIEFKVSEGIAVLDYSGGTDSRLKRIPYWLSHLRKHFKQRQPDVIVSFIARINVLTLLSLPKGQTKVIVSERNDPRHDSRTFITRALVNLLYPKADAVVFQTKEVMRFFSKKIQRKGTVIPNPIQLSAFADLTDYDPERICFAGRYSEQKDVPTLIDAAEIVAKIRPQVKFELYGTGPLKTVLEEMVREKGLEQNVLLHDNTPEIVEIMRKSRLFVLTSRYEGMSNALLEASYSGVPCLTTPVLGSDVVVEGENGYFFDVGDARHLAELILACFDEERYRALRARSIEMAKACEHEDVFQQWMELFSTRA